MRLQHEKNKRLQREKLKGMHGHLDGKMIKKNADFYFRQHPTCLRKPQSIVSTLAQLLQTEKLKQMKKKQEKENQREEDMLPTQQKFYKNIVKNEFKPWNEDKHIYDLKMCIDLKQKPMFGYPHLDFSAENLIQLNSIKRVKTAVERESHLMSHVEKCFTYGKSVRRDTASNPAGDVRSKIEDIKKKFNRIGLLRKFYSKHRVEVQKKFDFPIDQKGTLEDEIGPKRYDHLQFCSQSDFGDFEYPG